MADYCSLISAGIAALDQNTGETRRAFYDRARTILADRLRNADPPLPETFIEQERAALEDAIGKVEADEILSEGTWPTPNGLQSQSDVTADSKPSATVEASPAKPDAKQPGERRFVFWGFLILSALWIGDLLYKPPALSDWYDWLRLGGVIFFAALTILSYFIMRKNWSAEHEERAYMVLVPIILIGTLLVSVALYAMFG